MQRALAEDVIRLAMCAASSVNTQPWNSTVVTGEPLDRIRQGNVERNLAGVPESREFRTIGSYEGEDALAARFVSLDEKYR